MLGQTTQDDSRNIAALLDGFSPMEREAIRAKMGEVPIAKFHMIPAKDWLKYRGCGRRFLGRLSRRGWVAESTGKISVRAENTLLNLGIQPTKENIKEALVTGRLSLDGSGKPRNYGIRTHNELLRFVGLPEQGKKPRGWKYDPYTGKPLDEDG